jgi:hypothetical protein
MASLGDVNSDGYDDVAISADGRNRVYVFYGPQTGAVTYADADVEITLSTGGQLGYDIANAGDTNNDGYTDLVVSDPYANSNAGAVYIVHGPLTTDVDLTTTYGALLTGETASDYAGMSVAGIGDIDGDSYDDVLVGAPYYDGRTTNTGAAYIVRGNLSGTASLGTRPTIRSTGRNADDRYGSSVSFAGDVDGDANDDWLIASEDADTLATTDSGVAFIQFGQ